MSNQWQEETIGKTVEFAKWLGRVEHISVIYRGQADSLWPLRSSLDRIPIDSSNYADRLNREEKLLKDFRDSAYRFLGPMERVLISAEPDRKTDVTCMTVMQHFGAPTRVLDWTKSSAVAAYFACIEEKDKPGAIWWVNAEKIENSVHPHWEKRGFKRRFGNMGEVVLESGIFNPNVEEFVSLVGLPVQFPRAYAQRGLFTIASKLGIDHNCALGKHVPQKNRGRIIIPAYLKESILDFLVPLNTNKYTNSSSRFEFSIGHYLCDGFG